MRIFHVAANEFSELESLPAVLPATGYLWVGTARREFEINVGEMQAALQRWGIAPLVDLHISDLLNPHLPSHYDYTSWYDLLVFRRLAATHDKPDAARGDAAANEVAQTAAHQALRTQAIDTSPVGFAVFDRVLMTVHPSDCVVREFFAQRLEQQAVGAENRAALRLPTGPADLMLRMVNFMVDSYLDLRRLLTKQFAALQDELFESNARFDNWKVLLDSRNGLHLLEETCEDQRSAMQEWIDALAEWPVATDPAAARERELLRVRSSDVQEHIERVLSHVRRLESSAETAVQMHFSAQSHRTNDIMRTLTVLTAVFLPLNLITGFFGMNFDFLPFIHRASGFWMTLGAMALVGLGLVFYFRRKRYLGTPR